GKGDTVPGARTGRRFERPPPRAATTQHKKSGRKATTCTAMSSAVTKTVNAENSALPRASARLAIRPSVNGPSSNPTHPALESASPSQLVVIPQPHIRGSVPNMADVKYCAYGRGFAGQISRGTNSAILKSNDCPLLSR